MHDDDELDDELDDDDFDDEVDDDFEDEDDLEDDEVDDLDDEVDDDFEDEDDLEDDEVDDLDDEVDDDFEDEDEDDLEDDEVDDFDDEVVGDGGDDFGDELGDEVVVAVGGSDGAAARRRSRTRALAFGGVAVAALVLGWFVVRPAVSDDSSAAPADTTASSVEEGAASGEETSATTEPQVDTTVEEGAASGEETAATTEPQSATTVEEPEATIAEEEAAASAEQTSTTARRRSTTTVQEPATTAAEASGSVTYDTLPDGSPAPVVAVYDVDRITLTGAVPSEAARERLEALAVANAKPGQADTVDNLLTVNPDVPIGIGVRVVELTSVRFPPRSTEVLPAHARELDRAVAVMEALPNISALVIGHTDQVGDPLRNFAVSEQRADAVVNYMASQGIAPDRLASRAVGEEDLLTLADDEVARALNRRTEFVFYGLLVE